MSTQRQVFEFDDLEPVEVECRIGGRTYILREASSDAARKYRNAAAKAAKMKDGKVVGVNDGIADVEVLLVSLCLCETFQDEGGEVQVKTRKDGKREVPITVPESVILQWPARLTRTLFDQIKEISHLDEKENAESLRKQIDRLQTRLNRITEGETEADPTNTSAGSTTPG